MPRREAPYKWHEAQLRFLGTENYELGTRKVDVRFLPHGTGIAVTSRTRVSLEANALLGEKYPAVAIHDVEIVTEFVTLSLKNMGKSSYPQVLRAGDRLELF